MSKSPAPPVRLAMPCSNWLNLSLMIFGVVDAQNIRCVRILSVPEMIVLHEVGGKLKRHMLYQPTYSWHVGAVLLEPPEVAVLLKVICWYEDTLLAQQREIIIKLGETELVNRYEKLTQITRAIQTAPTVNRDQLNP